MGGWRLGQGHQRQSWAAGGGGGGEEGARLAGGQLACCARASASWPRAAAGCRCAAGCEPACRIACRSARRTAPSAADTAFPAKASGGWWDCHNQQQLAHTWCVCVVLAPPRTQASFCGAPVVRCAAVACMHACLHVGRVCGACVLIRHKGRTAQHAAGRRRHTCTCHQRSGRHQSLHCALSLSPPALPMGLA